MVVNISFFDRSDDVEQRDLIDNIDAILYVSDPVSYEMLYANEPARRFMKTDDYLHAKCYKVLHGKSSPCYFCTNGLLDFEQFYIWEHTSPTNGHSYLLKDKFVDWHGKMARLEIAQDITEQTSRNLFRLETTTLLECIRLLSAQEELKDAIETVLSTIGEYYQADRSYILELNQERTVGTNTFEWCRHGVESQIKFNQGIPLSQIPLWQDAIDAVSTMVIQDVEEIREKYPMEYGRMRFQNIRRLMAAPFNLQNQGLGYIGVDNPASNSNNPSLLQSVSYFVMNELQKRRLRAELEYQSSHDALTGLFNRNKYTQDIAALADKKLESAGVVFCDVNGLKFINDTQGHDAGDDRIRAVSKILQTVFLNSTIYRLGGDEFLVLCEDISKEQFNQLTDAARGSFLSENGQSMASIGARWERQNFDLPSMVLKADTLMYGEKQKHHRSR
ncbi:MAG: GGDEF domain-containing protein [Cloacibacillus sp.]